LLASFEDLLEQRGGLPEPGPARPPRWSRNGGPPATGNGDTAAHDLEDTVPGGHVRQDRLGDLPLAHVRRFHHSVEKVGLVGEAAVEGAHPDVGPHGDLLHGGFVPVLGEDVAGGDQNAAQVDLGVPPQWPRLHRCGGGPGAPCHARSSGPKAMAPTMTSASAVSAGCGSRSTMEGASRLGMASAASAATTKASPLTAKAST